MLNDPQKRQAYDQFGHAGVDPSQGGFHSQGGESFSDIFGDVFGDIFGGGQRGGGGRQRQRRGADLQYNLELTLEEAVKGLKKTIKIPTYVDCDTCDGSGAKKAQVQQLAEPVKVLGKSECNKGFLSAANLSELSWPRHYD